MLEGTATVEVDTWLEVIPQVILMTIIPRVLEILRAEIRLLHGFKHLASMSDEGSAISSPTLARFTLRQWYTHSLLLQNLQARHGRTLLWISCSE
jgi:hypothetical protein